MVRASIGCALMHHKIKDDVNRVSDNVVQVMTVTLIITAPK
jgi:hypothetical protein